MSSINFPRTFPLGDAYESIQKCAILSSVKCQKCKELISFDESKRSVTFCTERLIPTTTTNRPRVMLLFSNPHPHSVHQGMFLSPNTRGVKNAFWSVMVDAGWLPKTVINRNPKQLADFCLNAKYPGPIELIFYCFYAFPTKDPKDIRKIFGEEYFKREIEPKAMYELKKAIQDSSVEAVVTFNKEIFNLVSKDRVDTYIKRLEKKEMIQSQISGIDKNIPIFLTFPTGRWRSSRGLRVASLEAIRTVICSGLNSPETKDT